MGVLAMDKNVGGSLSDGKRHAVKLTKEIHTAVFDRRVLQLSSNDDSGILEGVSHERQAAQSLLNEDAGDLRRDEGASYSTVTTWQMSVERARLI
jgi:hypothetical protein